MGSTLTQQTHGLHAQAADCRDSMRPGLVQGRTP